LLFIRPGIQLRLTGLLGRQGEQQTPAHWHWKQQYTEEAQACPKNNGSRTRRPIRRVAAAAGDEGAPLTNAKIQKCYEFEAGRFVTIEDDERKALESKTAAQMEVLEFVPLTEVDPVYFETSYYIRPDPGGEKPFALLVLALQRAGLVALARFAMHRREHVTLIRSGRQGHIAHTMFYATEVRADEEYRAGIGLLKPKEIELTDALEPKKIPRLL